MESLRRVGAAISGAVSDLTRRTTEAVSGKLNNTNNAPKTEAARQIETNESEEGLPPVFQDLQKISKKVEDGEHKVGPYTFTKNGNVLEGMNTETNREFTFRNIDNNKASGQIGRDHFNVSVDRLNLNDENDENSITNKDAGLRDALKKLSEGKSEV